MATALNMTLRLKQDPVTQATIKHVKEAFATQIQPAIDAGRLHEGIVAQCAMSPNSFSR